MLIENRTARILLVSLLVLLLIPLLISLGMMVLGGAMMSGMQMGGMHMGAGLMALCGLWTLLVAAALIGLIVLLTRGADVTRHRDVTANMRSPVPR